jgi:hypothetical protein
LTIVSQNAVGNSITGYWTVLYNGNGGIVGTGYTPSSYTLSGGQTYRVEADSYRACTFSHWSGGSISGSTIDPVAISITGPTTIVAVYSGANCGPQTTTTTTATASSPSSSSSSTTASTTTATGAPRVTVQSVNQNGQPITGYWTVLYNGNGRQLATGYTSKTFSGLSSGAAYRIELDSYRNCQFNHWLDTGSTTVARSFTAVGAQTFVGVYTCTTGVEAARAGLAPTVTTGGTLDVLLLVSLVGGSWVFSVTAIAVRTDRKTSA